MKKTVLMVALLVGFLLSTTSANCETYVSGSINEDTVWGTAGSPYVLSGPVSVAPGATLTIEGGVEVTFLGKRFQSHETHFDSTRKGPGITQCSTCHENPIIKTGACDTCHSPDGAFDGVQMALANWNNIYESDAKTLKPGMEEWCATCHDDVPAFSKVQPIEIVVDNLDAGASFTGNWGTSTFAPGYYGTNYHYHTAGTGSDTFRWTPTIATQGTYTVYARWTADPSRAPDATYTISDDDGLTTVVVDQRSNGGTWISLGTYSFDGVDDYVELADSPNGYVIADAIKWESGGPATYAPNVVGDNATYGFYVTGHKINCLSCHDAGKAHIDGEHRTYRAGVTPYSNSYRLKDIGGAPAMNIPRPLYPVNTNPLVHWDDFALCFDCHNRNEVVSTNTAVVDKTNFWNNDDSPGNSHNIHLGIYTTHFDSDWDGVADSSESCIACHNVHGAPNQVMIRHGELISTPGTTDKVPALNFAYLVAPDTPDPNATLAQSVGGKMSYAGGQLAQNRVCGACHNPISYLRDPYLGPRVLNPKADPQTIDIAGGTQNVVLTATVLDHDNNVTSVTVDLSAIDGGVETMVHEGGGLYNYQATVPASVGPGQKALVVTATDPLEAGTNTIVLSVTQPGVVIVDNLDAGASFTGIWGTSTFAPGYNGTNYHYHAPGTGVDTFRWTPTITTSGTYEVFARWTQDPSRAPDATYTISDNTGTTPVVVDQRSNGGTWVSLGTYSFDGANDYVQLTDSPNGYVIADAIKFVLQ